MEEKEISMKNFHGLSGMSCSGIEFFTETLNKSHGNVVSTQSGICQLMELLYQDVQEKLQVYPENQVFKNEDDMFDGLLPSLFNGWYKNAKEDNILIQSEDLGRHVAPLRKYVNPNFKIIMFYRDIPDLIQCLVKEMLDNETHHPIFPKLLQAGQEPTIENLARASFKMIDQHVFGAVRFCMQEGWKLNQDFFIINYDEWTSGKKHEDICNDILAKLNLPPIDYDNTIDRAPIEKSPYINSIEPEFFSKKLYKFFRKKDIVREMLCQESE